MKIGILGGGQLGKMLYAPAIQMDMDIHYMDHIQDGPVAKCTPHYTLGKINDKNDVISWGQDKDVLSIEIEKVHTEALAILEDSGKQVYPQPKVIATIQDKGLQKDFYRTNGLPTSYYALCQSLSEVKDHMSHGRWKTPFVQKLRRDGYDGRGVHIIRSEDALSEAFDAPCVIEEMVDIHKELAVVTCRDQHGHIVTYDPVEMVFHPEANILLYQLGPAQISEAERKEATALAAAVSEAFGIVGLLAVELFLSSDGSVLINEVAPRPHNSGHHTIEAAACSQYENHLRAISGAPLGSTETTRKSLLMNVLGAEGHTGPVYYKGLEKVLAIPEAHVHIYGKNTTKPFRKMGHITLTGSDHDTLIERYQYIDRTLQVISR